MIRKLRERLSGESPAGSPLVIRSVSAEMEGDVNLAVQLQSEYQYILSLNEELNETTREEFYYDQVLSFVNHP